MIGSVLRQLRKDRNLSVKMAAADLGIDASLLSRIERSERMPTESHVRELAFYYQQDASVLLKEWLADRVTDVISKYPEMAQEVFTAAESRIEYLVGPQALETKAVNAALTQTLATIDKLKAKWVLNKPGQGLQLAKLDESFGVNYTFESNKIEGNTLSLQETHMVINEGLTIAGKSVQEHLEAINHDEAIEFVRDLASNKLPLTEYRLKQVHHLILKGIDRKNAGVYRSVPVRISGSTHEPPQPYQLSKLMEELFEFYKKENGRMHPVLLAAEMHERLVTIHPFIDGNGRTARLLMNLILLRNGYTIAILKGSNEDRLTYYRALQAVQNDADTTPFYELICGAVQNSLQEHLALI